MRWLTLALVDAAAQGRTAKGAPSVRSAQRCLPYPLGPIQLDPEAIPAKPRQVDGVLSVAVAAQAAASLGGARLHAQPAQEKVRAGRRGIGLRHDAQGREALEHEARGSVLFRVQRLQGLGRRGARDLQTGYQNLATDDRCTKRV